MDILFFEKIGKHSLILFVLLVIGTFRMQAQMVVESLDGPVATSEIKSFKSYIQQVSPGTGGNLNPKNDWVMHDSGQQTRAMGLMYEMTGDLDVLDRMIQFCDAVLSQRNDLAKSPLGGYTIWTGRIDPVWPNVNTIPIGTGGEQGDPPGHLAYCAKLILETPSLWGKPVRVGDPKGYGATYLDRAKRFVKEADYTMDHHILSDLLDLSDRNRMYWGAGNPYMTGAVPWNQQVMFTYALQYLADAHKILNDDPTRVSKYESVVQASVDWFFSGEAGAAKSYTDSKGNTAYLWAYRPPSGTEDFSHGNLDIQGIYRAYQSGKYGITDKQMLPLANTFMDVIRRADNNYAGRVDGTDGSGNSAPTTYVRPGWYLAALFRPADYATIVGDDLSKGKTTTDITRFSYFLWIKHLRYLAGNITTTSVELKGNQGRCSGTTFSFKTGVTESGRILFPQKLSGVKKQVSVYDLMGRLIQTETTSGSELVFKSRLAPSYGILLVKGFFTDEKYQE
jgi:hypothetical protein